jgi:hypothetical protein
LPEPADSERIRGLLTLQRVKQVLLGTERFHVIEEIKVRLEKLHGVRFTKAEIVAAMGKLRAAGYPLDKRDRVCGLAKFPEYRLRAKAAEQLALLGGQPDAFPD